MSAPRTPGAHARAAEPPASRRARGVAVCAVAVGVFLPLLGISLLAFLVLDVIVGGLKASRTG